MTPKTPPGKPLDLFKLLDDTRVVVGIVAAVAGYLAVRHHKVNHPQAQWRTMAREPQGSHQIYGMRR